MIGSIIVFVIAIAIAYVLLNVVFHLSITLVGILINSIVGAVILWVLNLVGVKIPINMATALIVGIFGIPGVIILLIAKYLLKII